MFMYITTATSSQLEKITLVNPYMRDEGLDHKAQKMKNRDWISALGWF